MLKSFRRSGPVAAVSAWTINFALSAVVLDSAPEEMGMLLVVVLLVGRLPLVEVLLRWVVLLVLLGLGSLMA